MAEAFKNAYQDVGTSYTAIYTCPASTEAVVIYQSFLSFSDSLLLFICSESSDSEHAAQNS